MRITNKQFYENYLASYDGQTVYTILSQVLFLLKKKYLSLFARMSAKSESKEVKELSQMVSALKATGPMSRQRVSSLMRMVQEKSELSEQLLVRISKQIDQSALSFMNDYSDEMKEVEITDDMLLFIQKGSDIYKRSFQ